MSIRWPWISRAEHERMLTQVRNYMIEQIHGGVKANHAHELGILRMGHHIALGAAGANRGLARVQRRYKALERWSVNAAALLTEIAKRREERRMPSREAIRDVLGSRPVNGRRFKSMRSDHAADAAEFAGMATAFGKAFGLTLKPTPLTAADTGKTADYQVIGQPLEIYGAQPAPARPMSQTTRPPGKPEDLVFDKPMSGDFGVGPAGAQT